MISSPQRRKLLHHNMLSESEFLFIFESWEVWSAVWWSPVLGEESWYTIICLVNLSFCSSSRAEKSEVLSDDLQSSEKKVDTAKHVYTTTCKKVSGSLLSTGTNDVDKRTVSTKSSSLSWGRTQYQRHQHCHHHHHGLLSSHLGLVVGVTDFLITGSHCCSHVGSSPTCEQ